MAYEKLVKEILKDVGGKENINGLTHCITRLRFNLRDEEKANTDELKEVPGVVTVVQSGGQYQVVIGNHVRDVYKEFIELSGLSTETEVVKEKKGLLDSFIDIISGIFTPVLGLLAATGMIKGLNVLFVSLGWFTNTSGTYAILIALTLNSFEYLVIKKLLRLFYYLFIFLILISDTFSSTQLHIGLHSYFANQSHKLPLQLYHFLDVLFVILLA